MDPNENLREQRDIVATALARNDMSKRSALRLVELVQALDEWLTGGGFLPQNWKR